MANLFETISNLHLYTASDSDSDDQEDEICCKCGHSRPRAASMDSAFKKSVSTTATPNRASFHGPSYSKTRMVRFQDQADASQMSVSDYAKSTLKNAKQHPPQTESNFQTRSPYDEGVEDADGKQLKTRRNDPIRPFYHQESPRGTIPYSQSGYQVSVAQSLSESQLAGCMKTSNHKNKLSNQPENVPTILASAPMADVRGGNETRRNRAEKWRTMVTDRVDTNVMDIYSKKCHHAHRTPNTTTSQNSPHHLNKEMLICPNKNNRFAENHSADKHGNGVKTDTPTNNQRIRFDETFNRVREWIEHSQAPVSVLEDDGMFVWKPGTKYDECDYERTGRYPIYKNDGARDRRGFSYIEGNIVSQNHFNKYAPCSENRDSTGSKVFEYSGKVSKPINTSDMQNYEPTGDRAVIQEVLV